MLDVGLPRVAQHVGLDVVWITQVGQARLVLLDGLIHRLAEVARVTEVHNSHSLSVFSATTIDVS